MVAGDVIAAAAQAGADPVKVGPGRRPGSRWPDLVR